MIKIMTKKTAIFDKNWQKLEQQYLTERTNKETARNKKRNNQQEIEKPTRNSKKQKETVRTIKKRLEPTRNSKN